MATPTYDLLASNVLTSAVSYVQFSNLTTLASGYKDLIIVAEIESASTDYVIVTVNGATSSGSYADVNMENNASQARWNYNKIPISWSGSTTTSGYRTVIELQAFDFANTSKYKAFLWRAGYAPDITVVGAGRYNSTTAANSIRLANYNGNNFVVGSTFHLYGLVA